METQLMPNRVYLTANQTADQHRAFTTGSLRWLIFNRHENGFDECLIRIGRRVLIDEQKFLDWVAKHREVKSLAGVILALAVVFSPNPMQAYDEIYLQPTLPYSTVPDYSRSGIVIEPDHYGNGAHVWQTLPGTQFKDYSQPGYRVGPDWSYPGAENMRDFYG
jgi:hypothetical protein